MRLFLCIISLIIFVSLSFAQEIEVVTEPANPEFPVITANSTAQLYEGGADKIKSSIESRKELIEQFIIILSTQANNIAQQITDALTQLEKNLDTDVVNKLASKKINKKVSSLKNKQETIFEILNNFKDIHYKHVNLLQELEAENDVFESLELEPPYTIKSVKLINDFLESMQQSKLSLTTIQQQNIVRLQHLSEILNDSIVKYTIALSDAVRPLKIYSLIRDIYLYQADYAIIKLQNKKTIKQLKYVIQQIDKQEKLFSIILENIDINETDFSELQNNLQQSKDELNKLIQEHNKLIKDFDKISLTAELELDNLEAKIQNSTDQTIIHGLYIQKQINLNKLQYPYFIKNLLQQKEQGLEVIHKANEFQIAWLGAYETRKKNPENFKIVLQAWQKYNFDLVNLKQENLQFLESLNRSMLDITRNKQLTSINQEKSTISSKHNKQNKLLEQQLNKNLKTMQRLSLQITDNNGIITSNYNNNQRILELLSQQLNKLELIGQWFGDKFKSQTAKIKNVLYYPLASFGDKPFTLATILTVLLYIILGFIFLRFFRKRTTNFLSKRTKLSEGASNSISTLLYYLGGFLVFMVALSAAGFNLGQMVIVFGALGVGIGFGLQNIANNFISGMILLIDRTLTVGDSITLSDGIHGKVSKLAMRYTVIRTNGGYDIIVPNSELIANRVTSMTFDDNYLRIEIPFGVSYDSDPEHVREITLEVANNVKHTINRESQKSAVLFSGMGDNSLDFVLRVWVFIYDRYRPYAIKSDYYFKLFKAFKEAGIEVPFPQRELHIRGVDKQMLKSVMKIEPDKDSS
ncbi:MAG: mechanosensitive ion channel [Proteobacteria bacterium]|nr:mechanosensitive ion channel [Pseudomonadota bacterium]